MTKPSSPARSRSDDKRLRIGILGCANIARAFARDVAHSPHVHVVAVASRNAAKAAAFANEFNVAHHHASYEALLADAAVQAIYLPLPNSLHAEWAVRAAQAGKHVLCEKPLALSGAQARKMVAVAAQQPVILLEAYPYYFQPQTGAMLELLHSGAIGTVQSVQASFGFMLREPLGNIRMDPTLGGGALLDAGSYPLSLIRLVMGQAPHSVWAHARWGQGGVQSGVDIATSATLLYSDGRTAQVSCAMDVATHRYASIVGTGGVIETEYLNHTSHQAGDHPLGFLPSQLRVRRGVANVVPYDPVISAVGSGFGFAAEAFAGLVARQDFEAAARAAAASVDIASTLEAIARSARAGRVVALNELNPR